MGKHKISPKPILKIPRDTLTPYNAQATYHFEDAFWGLYLPVTVAGRVSDIWRSYITQSLFRAIDVFLGFLPRPIVVQDRNVHSNDADFIAEIPLYTKSSFLTSYLVKNYVNENSFERYCSFIELLEYTWIDMYERGIVEEEDVFNIQEWISDLIKVGYRFPRISKTSSKVKEVHTALICSRIKHTKNITMIKEMANSGRSIRLSTRSSGTDKGYADKCVKKDNNPSLKFGCSGLHHGPRTDHPFTLIRLGQKYVNIGARKPPFANHPALKQLPGLLIANKNPSLPMRKYKSHSTRMKPGWPIMNLNHYIHNKKITSIDAFICSFPASMCQLWESWNKTMIFLAAHRYNLGRCSVKEWKELDEFLFKLNASMPYTGNTVGAVSRYDLEYLRYYTGIEGTLISSFGGFYMNSDDYKPVEESLLVIGSHSDTFETRVRAALQPEFKVVGIHKQYAFYKDSDIGRHRAIIILPYSVMSYKNTEFYAATIPMFVASPKFYLSYYDPKNKNIGLGPDRSMNSPPYCNDDSRLEEKMRPLLNSSKSIHVYSPNIDHLQDAESEQYWIQFSDFYDWPHIQHFDSLADLKNILLNSNLTQIHLDMQAEMRLRSQQVTFEWCEIIRRIKNNGLN